MNFTDIERIAPELSGLMDACDGPTLKVFAEFVLRKTPYCVVKREEAATAVWCAGYLDGITMRENTPEEIKRALRGVVEKLAGFTLPPH